MTTRTMEEAVDRTAAPPSEPKASATTRLLSLDTFRGLVILSMLIVNNLGDGGSTGYFWKHADWPEPWLAQSFREWFAHPNPLQFPLLKHCTLADYVMPSFMLIIGLAIPYSVAASMKRGVPAGTMWFRTAKRAALLVLLGWVLCYFRDQFAAQWYGQKPFSISCGMDVLQLLGVGYLLARVLYELPTVPRIGAAAALFLWHWGLLRFLPQGDIAAGTFTEHHNAVGYAYAHWPIWKYLTLHLGPVTIGWAGLLSVPPAAGMMLLGTVAGDFLRRKEHDDRTKVRGLAVGGAIVALIGLAWAFDLPFNKPRWTPCYLLWVAGVDLVVLAILYVVVDVRRYQRWTYPFVVLGSNAIAIYFLSILAKVLLLNTPRVTYGGERMSLTNATLHSLKDVLGAWAGGWTFTILFIAFWWVVLDQMYRRKLFWKL